MPGTQGGKQTALIFENGATMWATKWVLGVSLGPVEEQPPFNPCLDFYMVLRIESTAFQMLGYHPADWAMPSVPPAFLIEDDNWVGFLINQGLE